MNQEPQCDSLSTSIRLSLIIPCRDVNDPKLGELLKSIEAQDFPKDELETLIITEGTSESAKAIGIKQAKGDIIGILASDNELTFNSFLREMIKDFPVLDASYPAYYHYKKEDDILNRYFSLLGGNDPLSFYMDKNDKKPFYERDNELPDWSSYERESNQTLGDNGFFIKKELIESTDLENYYHVDNANEAIAGKVVSPVQCDIWHKTGGNIFSFFAKRYRYGLQHAFNKNRRWYLVDFRKPKDIWRLVWFILCTLTILEPLCLSIRGYLKIRDIAWFIHPIACLGTVFTYGLLVFHLFCQYMFRLLSAPMTVKRA